MYISRLVKTRDLHPGLLSITILSLSFPWLLISTSPFLPFIRLIFPLYLLFVYLGGSAATPSHIQRGPSVVIPSVQRPKLSHSRLHPHLIVQVGRTLSEALH
jgi:hypothetical protein